MPRPVCSVPRIRRRRWTGRMRTSEQDRNNRRIRQPTKGLMLPMYQERLCDSRI
jgi:hypothetical protein